MTYIRELLDRCDTRIELSFVRHRPTGTVHVVTPADPDVEPEFTAAEALSVEQAVVAYINLARSLVAPTLCGYDPQVWLDDSGPDEIVETFADGDLCWSCHRALGPHAHRAFEHPQPLQLATAEQS